MSELLKKFKSMLGKQKIGLALCGGSVLGAAHVGVLQAIEELDIKIDYVAGTSIGAFVGALFAFGKSTGEIKGIFYDLSWLDVSKISLSRFGLLSNQKLADILIRSIGEKEFKDARLPFAAVAANISTGGKVILNSGSVAQAVMASTSIPGIFQPVEIGGRLLVDGGIVENLPALTAKKMGADRVIAVNFTTGMREPKNIIDVLVNVIHLSINNNKEQELEETDIILNLELSDYNRVDMNQVSELIVQGYKQGKSFLGKAF